MKPQNKKRLIVLLHIALIGGFSMGLWFKNQAYEGMIIVKGQTEANVGVYRDSNGNVHILADNMRDLLFAQGYIEAMDRLFQCDLYRRVTTGRLAELLGIEAVAQDDFVVKALFSDTIENGYQYLANSLPEYHNLIQRYCDGMNYYVQTHQTNMPLEFKIMMALGVPANYIPPEFTVRDVLAMGLAMGQMLTYTPTADVQNWAMIKEFGWDNFTEIYDVQFNNLNFDFNSMELIDPPKVPEATNGITLLSENPSKPIVLQSYFQSDLYRSLFSTLENEMKGSNNWAVSPTKSANGRAILCNDPHLDVGTPGIFKGWHLYSKNEEYNAIGGSLPLVPLIVIGSTENIAWGLTTTAYDTTDTWVHEFNSDFTKYKNETAWQDTIIKQYEVPIRGQDPLKQSILEVPNHGILMDINGYLVTIRWASYNNEYRLMKALIDLNFAKNLDQFKAAMDPLTGWDHVLQNIVYADQAGNIGFIAAGKIPLRGNTNSYGILPLNGTNSSNNWQGWIPLAQLPQEWNPPRGYVCTANSFTTSIGASYPHYLSWKFIEPNRQNRIEEVLNSRNNHDTTSMNQLQGDSKEWWAKYIVPALLSALNNVDSGLPKQAKDLLESWDHFYNKSSIGATIFWETITILREKIVLDEMSQVPFGQDLVKGNFGFLGLFWLSNILVNGTGGLSHNWIDNINTPAVETVSELIQAAFNEAIANLENKYSNKIDRWTWETYFKITFVHPLAASVPQLSFLSNTFSSDGGHCVRALFPTGGASLRSIKIFGEDGGVSLIIPPGASGIYFSKYYNNQMEYYINNEIYIWQSNPKDVKRELTQIVAFNP